MTQRQHDDVWQLEAGFAHVSQEERAGDNPVVHHLSVFKTRARMLDDAQVERKARQLQAASSYDDWDGLSDGDKELWRHMARLELC
ncbi:hypothetical protein [Geodermatophilus sp. DSM 44513]|uniref:hypothetical protein n=1 Tax=Geodermatophilus sp. DSM 44513 TaxID=1528104 RepID=UPI0012823999|nr:hypothetical protein [Geodermatophilus sp. DSM 44513]WNV76525.1 hypothetical protein RTG05_04450 [Geodermatophilus sp. DSM 44513]